MLVVKCSAPSMKTVDVANGWPILTLVGTGYNLYFCNNNVLDLDGEAYAEVRSPDGVWVGKHEYPESGVSLGQPTWYLTNTITGENRTIYGSNKPQVRQPAPDGNPVDYTRRELYSDTTNGKQSSPRAWWVVRTNTSSDKKPTKCVGDIDVRTNFSAVYTFISCDFRRKGPAPAPGPELPIVLPPIVVPTPAPAPSVAPLTVALLPVVVPVPAPAVPVPVVAPAPAPTAAPPVQPVIPTVTFSMPPTAPPASSAISVYTGAVAIIVIIAAIAI